MTDSKISSSVLVEDLVERQLDDAGILRLVLNQPASRNALSEAMMAALAEALDAAREDPQVRVIVLAANGPAFCAGRDLKEMTAARAHPDNQADRGRLFQPCVGTVFGSDEINSGTSKADHCRSACHCHRRRLPAGGKL